MKRKLVLASLTAAAVCTFGGWAMSEDKPAAPGAGQSMPSPEEMAAWEAAGRLGPQHAAMKDLEGKFTSVVTMKMMPGAEPMTSEGTYEGHLAMGGRFVISKHGGNMMGMPYEGMAVMGYDNTLKKYVTTWMDSMNTGIMHATGTADETGKVITFEGESPDPMQGGKMMPYKFKYTMEGPDSFQFAMWVPAPGGGEMFECMNIQYTRVK